MDTFPPVDPATFTQVMATLRRRRIYFFATVIAYMPFMWAVSQVSSSFRSMTIGFIFWFILLFTVALISALARCPRCGNYFHMHGMSLLYLRRCLHCQLHISAKHAE